MAKQSLIERIQSAKISRRDFLKGAAVATAAVTFAGCASTDAPETSLKETEGKTEAPTTEAGDVAVATVRATDKDIIEGKGEWKPAACWHNCGGRCMNYAYVMDNTVVRQKTDDSHDDSWEYPQQRACVKGRAQTMQIFGADRIKYPMKRKNWSLENPNPQLRGKDEWERISWNEAIKLTAEALKKTYDTYGPRSVLSMAGGGECNGGAQSRNVLNKLGGCVTTWSTSSCGTYAYPWSKYLGLLMDYNMGAAEDRNAMLDADVIVLHGLNAAWSQSGLRSWTLAKCKEAGVQMIAIGPDYNATAQMLDATWIPVLSGTDTAFLLGVAYAMLEMDADKKLIDWDFLNKCTVGFDADHMPANAKTKENFKGYVLGDYDGIPKTPEWASKICGAPADQIRWYAEQIGKDKKVNLLHGYAPARCAGAENFPQMFMTIGAMGGHFGKAGHCCGSGYKNCMNNGLTMVTAGAPGLTSISNPIDDCICDCEIWSAVDTGKYNFNNKVSYSAELSPAVPRDIDIHAVYFEDKSGLNGYTAMSTGIKTLTKEDSSVDVIITNSYNYRLEARYADIVLPATTMWERPGRAMNVTMDREYMIFTGQVIEPLYEAKSDMEIGRMLAEELGLDPDELYAVNEKQAFFNMLAGATVYDKGEYVTLVTITDDDIKAWGVEGTAQTGKIGLEELCKQGIYQVPHDDSTGTIAYEAYVKDPEANPLTSTSGKFEIYSQIKADNLNETGMGDLEFKPYANYVFADESWENTFVDGDVEGEKTEYPYLAWNPHYLRRSHSVFDSNEWLREAFPNPVFLNKADAEAKGIANGDTVKIWNKFGAVLRNATISATIMPGMVGIPHGTWTILNEEGIDITGSDNILCGGTTSNSGVAGYNNYPVNFEKYTKQMESDSERGILLPGLE